MAASGGKWKGSSFVKAGGSSSKPGGGGGDAKGISKAGGLAGFKSAAQKGLAGYKEMKAIASRPLSAKTRAGKAGQLAARGAALGARAGSSINRALSSPAAKAAAFKAGQVTRKAVDYAAKRAKADSLKTAKSFKEAASKVGQKLKKARGFGK